MALAEPPEGPSWRRINESITDAGDSLQTFCSEIQKLENVPVLRLSQQMEALMALVRDVGAQQTALAARVDAAAATNADGLRAVNDRLRAVNDRLTLLTTEVTAIKTELRADRSNTSAKLFNLKLNSENDAIRPLRGADGQLIPDFPSTLLILRQMPNARITPILRSLGHTAAALGPLNVAQKRKLLEEEFGGVGLMADMI